MERVGITESVNTNTVQMLIVVVNLPTCYLRLLRNKRL